MNGADDFSPSINLGLRVDHGEVRHASGVGCDEGAFRDEALRSVPGVDARCL